MKTPMSILAGVLAIAVAGAAPVGTEFTYQGVLSDGGSPASGAYDFRLILYDSDAGGSQVGAIVFVDDLAVSEGRITTQLDFGDVFDGSSLWLEVGVRDGGSTGAYTVLSPRQQLTAAPYARHAATADSAATAATAGDAATLDGQSGAYYLSWDNLTGVPPGLDDGDGDTLADLSCGAGEIARWNGTAWSCSADDDTPFSRTFVVGPVGTPTENGNALRSAVAGITPPTSQAEAVLLSLEAGSYDLGGTGIDIPDWVTVAGAGESATLVTSASCGVLSTDATLTLGSDVGLRQLAVRNTCGAGVWFSAAVEVSGDRALIESARLEVTGTATENYALVNAGSHLRMINTTVKAENGTDWNTAVMNRGASAELVGVAIEVGPGGAHALGIDNSAADLSFRSGTVVLASAGVPECQGIRNTTGGDGLFLADLRIDTDCLGDGVGVRLGSTAAVLESLRITGDIGIHVLGTSADSKIILMQDLDLFSQQTGVICDGVSSDHPVVIVNQGFIAGMTIAERTQGRLIVSGVAVDGGGFTGDVACTACMRIAGISGSGTFLATGCP